MKHRIFFNILLLATTLTLLTSCGKLPQMEIDNAQLAITEAQNAGAELYAPEAFMALQDSMNACLEEIEVQKSKLFKNFKNASAKLLAVTENAAEVKLQTEAKISELKTEINNALNETTSLNNENKELVLKAPKGKGGSTVLMAIKGEIATIDNGLAEVAAIPDTENLNNKLAKVTALKEHASNINMELKTAIEKFQSRR
ncbi:MAG: hypothetical protein JW798_01285 [Prolixibacteraceae bacterium]|nr:hypothetical protein [Prolixibacteraceae bacterium]